MKLLIGKKRWNTLNQENINSLNQIFDQTMHRYVAEGMKFYDSQRLGLSSVKLNEQGTKGILTVEIEPIYLPSFKINFKISRHADQWFLYDILVEGISYVKMKKNEYRGIISEQGIDELLSYLENKNLTTTAD